MVSQTSSLVYQHTVCDKVMLVEPKAASLTLTVMTLRRDARMAPAAGLHYPREEQEVRPLGCNIDRPPQDVTLFHVKHEALQVRLGK
jgi:hypothetical protein